MKRGSEMTLKQEEERATELLRGKVVKAIKRHNDKELLIEFSDRTRLFVNRSDDGLELSITEP